MAAFREHVTFSTLLGLGYAVALKAYGWDDGPCLLAGGLCGVAGMFPDLDSASGKPLKELFGLLATFCSLFVFHHMRNADLSPANRILLAAGCYLGVRFGVRWLFARLTVHRGMWHSIPAACVAAEITYLASGDVVGAQGAVLLGVGVFLGFLSHLVLDEIYSVQLNGVVPRLKHSFGTALKLYSEKKMATLATWTLLAFFTYESAVKLDYARDLLPTVEQARSATWTVLAKLGQGRR